MKKLLKKMDNALPLLLSYPRKRPSLPEAYKSLYEKEYIINRERLSFASKLSLLAESWMHYKAASIKGDNLLEIGAGTLNHLKYEHYKTYDVIEPFKQFYQNKGTLNYINKIYEDILDVSLENKYDKILSVAVLEHLEQLPQTVARAGLLLKEDGAFINAIPSEGGILWHLGLSLTTGIGFRLRNKIPHSPIMRHEHINTSKEIIKIIKYFFHDVRIKRFPLPFHHLSLYVYIEAYRPKTDVISAYLSSEIP